MINNKITLQVYFIDGINSLGTAVMVENLITNDVQLELSKTIFLHEVYSFVEKTIDILKQRYSEVDVNINWDDLGRQKCQS